MVEVWHERRLKGLLAQTPGLAARNTTLSVGGCASLASVAPERFAHWRWGGVNSQTGGRFDGGGDEDGHGVAKA